MKHFVVIQRKHGLSIHIEDTAAMKREVINLSWQEASGLYWSLQDATKNPEFKYRDVKKDIPHNNRLDKDREFVKHVTLEETE